MRKNVERRALFQFAIIALAFLVLAGCATRITLRVPRTPTLDTSGINRVAVMPFTFAENNIHFQRAATHATSVVTRTIQNNFELVGTARINQARFTGENIENFTDALFVGRVTRIAEGTFQRERQVRNRDTNQMETQIFFERTVEVEFNYSFERARDGSILGPIIRSGRATSTANTRAELDSIDMLVNRVIDNQLRFFARDVAPFTITISRTLENDPRRELRGPMNDARNLAVRMRNYRAARDAYLDIWHSHLSIAAAINASILSEAMGETQNAADFMQEVLVATGSAQARNVLIRLNRELAEQAGVEAFDAGQTPTERVVGHALAEISGLLPSDARLWIQNNTTANHSLVNDVINNMESAILRDRRATLVERHSIDLILREQNLHIDGHVSDADFIRIGNIAGANTVVIVGVIGSGVQRRLSVRVVDITTGTVRMQSDTGVDWRL